TASIGISLYPEHGTTAEKLIRSADKAMYQVKREGKNSFGFVNSAGF
ncbi:MAG: diguanylate cyclase, partial [Gammaproteobacteria bacterium]|nr:diguanylate cyclase [Gammaproteobacteria bacterium]